MSTRSKPIYKSGEGVEQRKGKPPYYNVFLLNDNYTTMDFVVYILECVFHKTSVEATQIMLNVHKNGRGLAGIYTKEIAETKVEEVHKVALEHEFPLRCVIEKV